MLNLSRYEGQSIVIGHGEDEVWVNVGRIVRHVKVKLSINAPSHIPVDREEIRINKEATGSDLLLMPSDRRRTSLVVMRHLHEKVIIGHGRDQVVLQVMAICRAPGLPVHVQMAFEAPPGMPIDREEIRHRKEAGKTAALAI